MPIHIGIFIFGVYTKDIVSILVCVYTHNIIALLGTNTCLCMSLDSKDSCSVLFHIKVFNPNIYFKNQTKSNLVGLRQQLKVHVKRTVQLQLDATHWSTVVNTN